MSQLDTAAAVLEVPAAADDRLRALPKVSLHEHLDGSVRADTLIDLSAELGTVLPATTPASLRSWLLAQSHSGSLVQYLKSFALTSTVMQSAANLQRIAREYVHDLVADGIIYAEVRWAPEKMTLGGLSLDEAVEAVRSGLRAGAAEAASQGTAIEVNQIITAMRAADRVDEVADLALRHHGNGVVAFDLAGPEAGYPTSLYRTTAERVARRCMPMTIHAGEADGLDSIDSALFDGRALRLGHGVRIAEDINDRGELGELARWVRDRGIVLETSPTSNYHTGVFAAWGEHMTDHPFDRLYRHHFQVTVNTDNRLMSDTTLSNELHVLQETFGYGLDDLERFQLNAARGAFVDTARRDEIAHTIREGFDQARA